MIGYFGEPVNNTFETLCNMLFIHPEYIPTSEEMSSVGIELRKLVTDYIAETYEVSIYDIIDGRGHIIDRKPMTIEDVRYFISNTSRDVVPTGKSVTRTRQRLGKVWRDKTREELVEEWMKLWSYCEHRIDFLGYHVEGKDHLIDLFSSFIDDEDIII